MKNKRFLKITLIAAVVALLSPRFADAVLYKEFYARKGSLRCPKAR